MDFNDVKRVMSNSGVAIIGIGKGSGENRAVVAINEAMNSPLLEDADIYGAKGVVLYITYGNGIKMRELDLITESIQSQTQTDCEIIWGVCKDENLEDDIAITLVATGFQTGEIKRERKQVQRQIEEKVVYTLKEEPKAPVNKEVQAKSEVTPPTKEVNNEHIVFPLIDKVEDKIMDDDLFIPTLKDDIKNENEIEFEINLSAPEMDIKIVDKPRFQMTDDIDDGFEKVNKKETQFTLFETNSDSKAVGEIDAQDLERDLIKKRITLDMEKHHISIYELEKEPAYKRYGLDLEKSTPSEESNFSNFMIYSNSEDPMKIEIRPNAMKDITLD